MSVKSQATTVRWLACLKGRTGKAENSLTDLAQLVSCLHLLPVYLLSYANFCWLQYGGGGW